MKKEKFFIILFLVSLGICMFTILARKIIIYSAGTVAFKLININTIKKIGLLQFEHLFSGTNSAFEYNDSLILYTLIDSGATPDQIHLFLDALIIKKAISERCEKNISIPLNLNSLEVKNETREDIYDNPYSFLYDNPYFIIASFGKNEKNDFQVDQFNNIRLGDVGLFSIKDDIIAKLRVCD